MARRRVNIRIVEFVFDDENQEKFAGHGLTARRVDQILDNPPYVVVRNRKFRRGGYRVIGVDDGDACIVVPIEATKQRGVWRPITAWLCTPQQNELLRRSI